MGNDAPPGAAQPRRTAAARRRRSAGPAGRLDAGRGRRRRRRARLSGGVDHRQPPEPAGVDGRARLAARPGPAGRRRRPGRSRRQVRRRNDVTTEVAPDWGLQLIRSTPPLPLKDMDFFMAPPSAPLRANQEADRNGPNSTPCRLICTSNPEWPIRSSKRSKLLPLQVFKGELDLGAQFKLK